MTLCQLRGNNKYMENILRGKKYVGVDGCHYGWFAVMLDGYGHWEVARYTNIGDLWEANKDSTLILIDIPIGLRENCIEYRTCDIEVRRLMRERINSVFFAPCRDALNAPSHNVASKINKDKTDKGLSIQAWSICKKIKEVDDFLRSNETARSIVKETHPELCFTMLNNANPLRFAKKHSEGNEERLKLLLDICKPTNEIVRKSEDCFWRKDVAKDDILDALVLAVTASFGENNLKSLPEKPELDDKGLPMQMVYYLKNAKS